MSVNSFTATPTAPTTVKLGLAEVGKFAFTVTSLAGPDKSQDVLLRALLVSKNGTDKREEVDWLTVEPRRTLNIAGGVTEIITIVARPTNKSPRGANTIQLAICDDDQPNETYTYSAPVVCEVVALPEVPTAVREKTRFPPWLIPVIAAAFVLLAGGIVLVWRLGHQAAQDVQVPSGSIMAFAGETPPDGWLLCDGAPISRTTFRALFAAVGDAWGAGDGKSTFNLPDLRGFFLRGADGQGLHDPGTAERKSVKDGKPAAGLASIQTPATALPIKGFRTTVDGDHSHLDPTYAGGPGPFEVAIDRGPGNTDFIPASPTSVAGSHSHSITGGDQETRPINVAVNYLIKI